MPIRKLPTLLVNQIAAGEVIERPASVVKELLENSLDAGATRIDIAIEEGGTQLIRIADDGHGIPAEELHLAVAPHATSKLTKAEDLEAIATFGFRGEALASIASVSRLRLRAAVRAGEGGEIQVEGDTVSDVRPHAGAPGTVVEVRDLFFNTPARRRFMRSAPTEFGHIHEAVVRAAMAHPAVGFRLSHNGRVARDLPPGQDRRARCVEVLGRELEEGLLEFAHTDASDGDGYAVWGLAGQPALSRGNGKGQYLCVNGRPIRDRNLQHAIKEAYRGLMPHDRFPLVVAFVTMDPRLVDVNVHPTKSEVRFGNPSRVHGLVHSAIRQRLLGEDLTPSAAVSGFPFLVSGSDGQPETRNQKPETQSFVDFFRRMDPTQKSLVYEDIKRDLAAMEPTLLDEADPSAIRHPPSAIDAPPSAIRHTPILQVARSYLVTEDDAGGILIVDQHALHERVMFEQLRRRVLEQQEKLESQRLLMPVVIDCDPRKQELLDSLRPLLERIGIEAEPIGPDAVAVQAFPSFLFDRKVAPAEFVSELLDRADSDQSPSLRRCDGVSPNDLEAALHEVLDMMACKAAVKAGDHMSETELAELLKMRLEVERSSNCPHGRPTTLRLSLKDLEKQFGRV